MEDGDLVGADVAPGHPSSAPAVVTSPASASAQAPAGAAMGSAVMDAVEVAAVEVAPGTAESDEAAPGKAMPAAEINHRSGGSIGVDDRRTLEDLMRTHGDAVLGYCVRMLGDRQLAEEVKQQTFYEACRDLDSLRERSSRISWLFGVARHRCLDAIRRQAHRSTLLDSNEEAVRSARDPSVGPGERLEHAQITASLEDCLKLLSTDVRTTVLLRYQWGLPYEELATVLSASAAALQMRVARALPVLRRCLEAKGFYDV